MKELLPASRDRGCKAIVLHCTYFILNNAVLFGQRATIQKGEVAKERRSVIDNSNQKCLFAPRLHKIRQTLCYLLVFTQLFQTRNKERSNFRSVY